jgi:hypothetical protein
MALGIGANTAVFSVIYGVLVKSLPFTDADRIVSIGEVHPQAPGSVQVTYPLVYEMGMRILAPVHPVDLMVEMRGRGQ